MRAKGRTTWHETVAEMQTDLEACLETYDRKRPHRSRGMEGRTPYQVFKAGLADARKAAKARKADANKKASMDAPDNASISSNGSVHVVRCCRLSGLLVQPACPRLLARMEIRGSGPYRPSVLFDK